MTTQKLSNLVSDFVESGIIPPIVEYINNEYDLKITVNELVKVLNIEPPQEQSGTLLLKLPNVPSIKRNTFKKQIADDERCKYVYKKPPRKGEQCSNKAQGPDIEFCKACSRKKTSPESGEQTKLTTVGFTKSSPNVKQKIQVYADPMIDYPDCFEMKEYKYIVKEISNGDKICIGTKTNEKDVYNKLTQEDIDELEILGFKYVVVDNVKEKMKDRYIIKENE